MIPSTFYVVCRDHGPGYGFLPFETPTPDQDAAIDLLIASFNGDTMPADLTTVQVWHFTVDCPPADVTRAILTAIGTQLSETHDATTYPDPFADWASDEIKADIRCAADGQWAVEQRDLNRSAA